MAQWLADKKLNEDAGVMAANREQSCSNSCDSAEEKLLTLADAAAGSNGEPPHLVVKVKRIVHLDVHLDEVCSWSVV